MNYLEYLTYSEFLKLINNMSNWEFLVKYDCTLSLNYGLDENGFFTGPNNTIRPIDKSICRYKSEDWKMANLSQNNSAILAHEIYKNKEISGSGKLNILFGKIPNYISYNSLVDTTIIDFSLPPQCPKDVVIETSTIQVQQTLVQSGAITTETVDVEYQIIPPVKVCINIGNYILTKLNRNNWNDIVREIKNLCIEQASKIRTNIIDPSPGYSHDGIIIKSGGHFIIVQNDQQYNMLMSRDWEPINRLNAIIQNLERNRITQEKAIEQINELNNHFREYFPKVAPIVYPKIIQQFEHTKIKIQQR
jgi:hypothetical protein